MTHPTGPGGVDLDKLELGRLCAWMDAQGLGHGALDAVATLSGGTQNILVQFTRAGQEYVLRRPPRHLRDNSNEAMRREARVLAALAGTAVPHPRLIAACADASVLGAAFTLMEKVDGFNATAGLPKLHAASAMIRHSMGLALVDGIAALAGLDYRALGLDGLGRPENFLARQVPRWRAQLDSYAALQGWPGQARIPGVAAVAAWLEANRPSQFDPGIMHGDYHLANVLYRPDGPALAAIVDWELVTIGDPLLDLGWLLATWPQEGGPQKGGAQEGGAQEGGPEHGGPRENEIETVPVRPWNGFPTAAELVARYRQNSSRDVSAIDWYAVLACFKLGIILEGTHARACAGHAPRETGDSLHAKTVSLFERALRLIQ